MNIPRLLYMAIVCVMALIGATILNNLQIYMMTMIGSFVSMIVVYLVDALSRRYEQ